MTQGTNDYNKKYIPAEVVVSRTLQAKNRNWSNVIWRTGKPALDSEWNLISDMTYEALSNTIRSSVPSGWLDLGKNKFPIGNAGIANIFRFYTRKTEENLDVPNVLVNGWPIVVGGVNYTDTSINSITLPAVSPFAGQHRYDMIFLEVWRAQVRSRDPYNNPIAQNKPDLTHIYAYGNIQFGGTHFIDDIVDEDIQPSTDGIETSQRVQIQYRVRIVSYVPFANVLVSGFESALVQGQGASLVPQIAGYQFTNMASELNDAGLWRAGTGDQASRVALGSVDGYSYAIPMFKVFRRSRIPYSDTGATPTDASNNQYGNATALTDLISDRPDGKFYDGIDATDIQDVRAKISFANLNYDRLLEESMDSLLRGDLATLRSRTLHYDSISDADVNGYIDILGNVGCNGKRNIWSDAATIQTNVYASVKITTSNSNLDAYRSAGAGAWANGNTVVVQVTAKAPAGSIIKATPRVYLEDLAVLTTDLSGTAQISWAGLNTATATMTIVNNTGFGSKDLWIYYDLSLPNNQGLDQVPNEVLRINYFNHASYPGALLPPDYSGVVVRGERLEPNVTRFQDLLNHTYHNTISSSTSNETEVMKERKQLLIQPLIQSTSTRDGGTRTLEVENCNKTTKVLKVPFGIQHLKGVYTSGATEIATQLQTNVFVSNANDSTDEFVISNLNYIAEMTSLLYSPSGAFSGDEIELLIASGGVYAPVYTHKNSPPETPGTRVRLYTTTGVLYDIPIGKTAANYKWTGRRIRVRNGSGYGYDIGEQTISCISADNVGSFPAIDNTQLFIDMDYYGAPHSGADLRIIYDYTPYQGVDVGSQELEMIHKRQKGVFFNNGTGGGNVSLVDGSGTSNYYYSPMSPRLPGIFDDYLRDGQLIELSSVGNKRFDTDAIFQAAYDLYGYYGGGNLWANDFVLGTPETTSRGFYMHPMLEVIFEDPNVDQINAEFFLPLLVRDKFTNELFLYIQIGNKGIHKEVDIYLDIFRLKEKILIK